LGGIKKRPICSPAAKEYKPPTAVKTPQNRRRRLCQKANKINSANKINPALVRGLL